MKRLRDQQFADFGAVSVGGVDKVHTELDDPTQNFERIFSISRPTPDAFAGDPHRAKAESINREIAAQEEGSMTGRTRCQGRGLED
jgi:hypothetical protein